MSLDAPRFVYNGQPVYNRHHLMGAIAQSLENEENANYVFDIVLETVRILENAGIIGTIDGPACELFAVHDWEKIPFGI